MFNPLSPDSSGILSAYERLRTSDPCISRRGMLSRAGTRSQLVLRDKRFGKDYVERTIRRYGGHHERRLSHMTTCAAAGPPDTPGCAAGGESVHAARSRICVADSEIVDETLDRISSGK